MGLNIINVVKIAYIYFTKRVAHLFAHCSIGLSIFLFSNLSLAGQVGTTMGAFQVTADGQSSYSMAIEVPPGIMGVVPQVAVSYTNGSGNGLLGIGGNLSGLSSITRCGKTIEQDGISKAVQFDSSDYFCLNGQRLILMSGSYGANGSVYQTQLESFQRVTAHGSIGGGPAYFEVLAKGGSKLVFGKSLSGVHLERTIDTVSNAVASWGISYLEDKYSNRVIYEYENQAHTEEGVTADQILPTQITYGHNVNANVVGKLKVKFVYETRPDVTTGYGRGKKYINNQRLSKVQTFVDTQMVNHRLDNNRA